MPTDPIRILSLIRKLDQTSLVALKEVYRELLLSIKRTLQEDKREVDKTLLRLSFLDQQQMN